MSGGDHVSCLRPHPSSGSSETNSGGFFIYHRALGDSQGTLISLKSSTIVSEGSFQTGALTASAAMQRFAAPLMLFAVMLMSIAAENRPSSSLQTSYCAGDPIQGWCKSLNSICNVEMNVSSCCHKSS